MTISRFPHGILATPNLGGAGYGIKGASSVYFVDGSDGSDDQNGESPDSAFQTIGEALDKANAWDVIYIAPKDWTSGAVPTGTPYKESATDLSIAYAKQGLALVGIAHQNLIGPAHAVAIRGVTSSTNPILKVHAPMVAVENICFDQTTDGFTAGTAINDLYFYGDVAGTSEAHMGSVFNCGFNYGKGSGATGDTGGAIYGHAVWGMTIDECWFQDCRIGVSLKSDAGTGGQWIVRNCNFTTRLTTASTISADIYVYTQGSTNVQIYNIFCGHVIPTYTSGHGRYIIINADVRNGLLHNVAMGVAADTTTALTVGPSGTGIICPAGKIAVGAIYSEGVAASWAA